MSDELPGADSGLLDRTVDRVRVGARPGLDVRLAPDQSAALADELDRLTAERDRFRAAFDREDLARRKAEQQARLLGSERDRLVIDRDRLAAEFDEYRSGAAAELDRMSCVVADSRAARNRLAEQVQRVRDLADVQAGLPGAPSTRQVHIADLFAALDGDTAPGADPHARANDLIRSVVEGEPSSRRPGESLGEYGVRLGLRPGVGGQPIEAIGDGDDVDPRLT